MFLSVANKVSVFWLFRVGVDLFSMKRVPFFRYFFDPCWSFLTILGPLGAPFWAFWGPKWLRGPKRQGGTDQNLAKGGQKAIQMCFGTVLDHLDAILVHFEQNLKIDFLFFLTF